MVGEVAPFRVKCGGHDKGLPLPHRLGKQHRVTVLQDEQIVWNAVASHTQVPLHLGQVGVLGQVEDDIIEELMPYSQVLCHRGVGVELHD